VTAVDRPSITGRIPVWSLILTVLAAIAVVLAALAAFGGALLPDRSGPPIEELSIERTTLAPGSIEITVRNAGPDTVQIAQVFVNDTYVDFTGSAKPIARLGSDTLQLRFPWISGQPYTVSMLTSTGLVIEHTIPAAVATPEPGAGLVGLMALLGTYVGIIPVALGMLVLPILRRASRGVVRMLLALTVGLLGFLAVDAAFEGFALAERSGVAFGGAAARIARSRFRVPNPDRDRSLARPPQSRSRSSHQRAATGPDDRHRYRPAQPR